MLTRFHAAEGKASGTAPQQHAVTHVRPGVYVQAWRGYCGEYVVVGVGADGRSVTESPRTATTAAELAAVCSELTALVFPSSGSPDGVGGEDEPAPALPATWPSDAHEMAPAPLADTPTSDQLQQLRVS